MKILSVISLLFGVYNTLFAQSRLEVVVKGVKNDNGNIRVGIFSDKDTFLKKAAYGKVVRSKSGQTTVIFDDLPPGKYAVSAIHDENKNNELDTGMFGIPKEGFGFGNDAMGTFGPPGFEKATITIEPGKMLISITLRYL